MPEFELLYMKQYLLITLSVLLINCGSNNHITEQTLEIVTGAKAIESANTILAEDLKTHLYIIASDEFEGRNTGEPGQKMAAEYLKSFYINSNK